MRRLGLLVLNLQRELERKVVMGINRRGDQEISSPCADVEIRVMSDASTGSEMMTVLEVRLEPGGATPYQANVSHEESWFIYSGDVSFVEGATRYSLTSGDCVLVAKGVGMSVENVGSEAARIVTMSPDPAVVREELTEPDVVDGSPGGNVLIRAEYEAFEFAPGVMRVDMVDDARGATSSYFSELSFSPGAHTPNHYHPAHEETMFCIEGEMTAVYGAEEGLPLPAGDVFLCEPTIRHATNNPSSGPSKLLAIHPVLNPPPRVIVD